MKIKATPRPLTQPLPGSAADATVAVEPMAAGHVSAPSAFFERAGNRTAQLRMLGLGTPRSRWWTVPCPSYLIHHPTAGPFLVDTGLHPSVTAKPAANLGRITSGYAKPTLAAGEDVPARLRAKGLDAKAIRFVVMTHMHFDHSSGMAEFPNAAFVVSEPEWASATTEPRPFLHGYRRAHFDYAFDYRTVSFDGPTVTSYASFGRTFDLFGDGSVRLAFTPGHSAGHMAVICRLRDRDLVIAGDSVYTLAQLGDAAPPPRPYDAHNWRRTLQELKLFASTYPQAVIVPSHDPAVWESIEARYE